MNTLLFWSNTFLDTIARVSRTLQFSPFEELAKDIDTTHVFGNILFHVYSFMGDTSIAELIFGGALIGVLAFKLLKFYTDLIL